MEKKWLKIQSILEKCLASGQYKVWIAPLAPSWEGEGLTLHAPSEFAATFIRGRLLPRIAEAARDVFGRDIALDVQGCPKPGARKTGAKKAAAPKAAVPKAAQTGARSKRAGVSPVDPAGPAARALPEPAAGVCGHKGATAVGETAASRNNEGKAPPPSQEQAVFSLDGAGRAFTLPLSTQIDQMIAMRAKNTLSSPAPEASPRPLPCPRPLPEMRQLTLPLRQESRAQPLMEQGWRFSFEDFMVGPCNELAYAASRSVCDNLLYADMLYLSSAPGLGKTHLMQAVGKALCTTCNRAAPKVEYLTAEQFASDFYFALKCQNMESFKSRFRNLDLFLLEDVHFLQGKEKMQTELLATLKALREHGSKVVFTSSFVPRDLKLVDEQLQSRLCSGLLAVIDRPDETTRRKILRHKASLHQVLLPEDVEDALVRHIRADVRQIESCLGSLILKAQLLHTSISMPMVREILGNYAAENPVLDMDAIVEYVCRSFGISRDQLISPSRKKELVCARDTAFFLARKHTDLSLEAIGRRFNRRHSTVMKGITRLEREVGQETPQGRQYSNALTMIEKNGNLFSMA